MEVTVAINDIPNFKEWLANQTADYIQSDMVLSYFLKEKYDIILSGNYHEFQTKPVVEYLTFESEQQYTMFLLNM